MMGRFSQVSPKVAGNKGLAELNHHVRDEPKEVRKGVMGEGQGLSEEDESRMHEVRQEVNVVGYGKDQAGGEQQQLPGPIVQWERFLPFRTLKVLLVEDDDSTRHVLTALLRNCSYEVSAAANDLQAWKILEDLTNNIDLVLADIAMPYLSGIGLLCKIMSHKSCKTIPVIMMSSNDSMGTVFKCLSKGAVDFLVKPIRKNELKNLWQHVWRRCHSSSGSGSESGVQSLNSDKSKSFSDSDNNTGSDDDNGSIGLHVRDGSDDGSGTQSSWTKRAVEVESSQQMSPSDHLARPHNSTCAQVIHLKPETFCNGRVPLPITGGCHERRELNDDDMGKNLEIGVPRNQDTGKGSYPAEKVPLDEVMNNVDKLHNSDPRKDLSHNELKSENSNDLGEPSTETADLIGAMAKSTDPQFIVRDSVTFNSFSVISDCKDKTIVDPNELPSLELSLKRLRSTEEGTGTHVDRNILRRSVQSAFSRYNTSAASTQAPTGYAESCSLPLNISTEAMKTNLTWNMISDSTATSLKQGPNGASNYNDMGYTTKNTSMKRSGFKEKAASPKAAKSIYPSSAFNPVQHLASVTEKVMEEKRDDVAVVATVGQPRAVRCQVQVQCHHHHYHHHHHVHNTQQQQLQPPPDHNDLSAKDLGAAALHCGSSNAYVVPLEGNAANFSLNGSLSGSNHGSKGQNGGSTAVNAGEMNMESDNGAAGKSDGGGGNRSGSGSGSGSGVVQDRSTEREAALNKFLQKRKERNFEKKVRYQSRKRLAEQRPRVRGQFVRQIVYEHTRREGDS